MRKKQTNAKLRHVRFISLSIAVIIFFTIALHKKLNTPFKTNNFVSLHMSNPPADTMLCIMMGECDESEAQYEQSQASGIAFKTVSKKTYILTADHFCESYADDSVSLENGDISFGSILYVENYLGHSWPATVIARDKPTDLCLVSTDEMPPVKTIKLAKGMPKIGSDIYTVSEPLGIGPNGTALHFTGKFSGCDTEGDCYYSIPATFGSSGSIVLNDKGEMVGMIQKAIIMLQVMSIGVGADDIEKFLNYATELTGDNLL